MEMLTTIPPRAARLMQHAGMLAVLVLALLQPGEIRANVFVQCGVDPAALPPGTYSTLNAALSALSLEGPHTITVTGTCQENVQLQSRERLTIQGPEGGTATIINAADPPFWVFAVDRSRQIRLSRLIVSGGSIGIRIDSASSIDIIDCIAENNGLGVLADENSTLRMNRFASRNNQGNGLVVSRSSQVSFSLGGPEPPFVHIHGNGGAGISINSGTVTISRAATVENNGGAAIIVAAGRLQMNGGPGEAGNISATTDSESVPREIPG